MRAFGEFCLLAAFVTSAYSAFACITGSLRDRRLLFSAGMVSAAVTAVATAVVTAILAMALWSRDFSFGYVAQYSSRLLPWYYSLSALWVGQAGSLLLWALLQVSLAMMFAYSVRRRPESRHRTAFGCVMLYVCFLLSTLVFGVNPLERNITAAEEGAGLSPLLQHPAMLIHPPIVFLAYAAWTIPCALALSVLLHSRGQRAPDGVTVHAPNAELLRHDWISDARPWALFAWMVLGTGILLGAQWSYEELGWGGYWGWDPVENGSLLPWLTGTALLHGFMAWRFRGILKTFTLVMVFLTFGLCNFATFLTRSGIFSSLHAFSQSPIGWLFLGLMLVIGTAGLWLIVTRRQNLAPENTITSLLSCESQILISAVALLLLACVVFAGTISAALSEALIGHRVVVGVEFYNYVLIPTGLTLLATMAFAPLLRWGRGPLPEQRRAMARAGLMAAAAGLVAWFAGVRQPIGVAVTSLASLVVAALLLSVWRDAQRVDRERPWSALVTAVAMRRHQYTGYLMHIGFVCLAVGIAGSALGSRRHEVVLSPGQSTEFAGYSVRFDGLRETDQAGKFVAAAELHVSEDGGPPFSLFPAQHFHHLQQEWTTEVAINANWRRDFYTILLNGESDNTVRLVLVENPLMRWLWAGGFVMATGTLLALSSGLTSRRRSTARTPLIGTAATMTAPPGDPPRRSRKAA